MYQQCFTLIEQNDSWDISSIRRNATFVYSTCCFCEDYKRVVINARHKLILIQAMTTIIGNSLSERKANYSTYRRTPHIMLNEINKLSLFCALESGYLNMSFRSLIKRSVRVSCCRPSKTKYSRAVKTAA